MQIASSSAPRKQLPDASTGSASWWEPAPDFATPLAFENRLRRSLAAARRETGMVAVLVMLVDAAGAAACRRVLRDTDVVTRRDDGTLAVLLDRFDSAADAARVADLVATRLRGLAEADGGALGIAISEPRDRSPQALLDRALACLVQTADQ
ncbi:MAG: hypothetical protein ABW067_12035 [Rhizobacter sp.]|jgi:hypothetical protein